MLRGKLRRHFRNSGFIVTGIAHNQRAFANCCQRPINPVVRAAVAIPRNTCSREMESPPAPVQYVQRRQRRQYVLALIQSRQIAVDPEARAVQPVFDFERLSLRPGNLSEHPVGLVGKENRGAGCFGFVDKNELRFDPAFARRPPGVSFLDDPGLFAGDFFERIAEKPACDRNRCW